MQPFVFLPNDCKMFELYYTYYGNDKDLYILDDGDISYGCRRIDYCCDLFVALILFMLLVLLTLILLLPLLPLILLAFPITH